MDTRPTTTGRGDDGERGFSLIELMTVVMIIGVLIAVLIPNFLQAKKPAMDRQAQSLLRDGVTATRAVSTSETVAPSASALATTEPTLDVVDAATSADANRHRVSVDEGTSGGSWYLILASHSTSGRCYALLEREAAATAYQRVESATCRADQFDPASGWSASW